MAFRGLLPTNLIGRHALGHIERELICRARIPWGTDRSPGQPAERSAKVLEQVLEILYSGQHAELNTRLRALWAAEQANELANPNRGSRRGLLRSPRRLLLGLHDAESFARAVEKSAKIRRLLDSLAGTNMSDPNASV